MVKQSVKSIIKANLNNEMAVAIVKLVETPSVAIKINLSSFLIVTSSLSAYLLIQSCLSYLSYEVLTTTRVVSEVTSVFPKITLCNLNPFTSRDSLHFLAEIDRTQFALLNDETALNSLSYQEKHSLFRGFYGSALREMNRRNLSNISHNFDDIILSCKFNQEDCSTKEDFQLTFDKSYGACIVFNSGFNMQNRPVPLKKSLFSGFVYRLEVELYVNFHENLTHLNSYNLGRGAIVRIENNSYLSDDASEVHAAPGHYTSITVDRSFKFYMAKPYSRCDLDNDSPADSSSKLFKLIKSSEYAYKAQLCYSQCYQSLLVNDCNCTDWYIVSLFDRQKCFNRSQLACNDRVFRKYINSSFFEQNCLPLCPLECNQSQFRVRSSASQLIGEKYLDFLRNNSRLKEDFVARKLDSRTAQESFVKIGVYYESLSYEMSTESAKMDVVSMLANIGGNLGLFLGVSVLSLCELIGVALEILVNIKKK